MNIEGTVAALPDACLPACLPVLHHFAAQVACLEQQCQAGAAELRDVRLQCTEAVGQLEQQHAAQVGTTFCAW